MKKCLALVLSLLLVLPLLPRALAADVSYAVTGGNIYFDASTGTVTKADQTVTEAVIPEEIYGVKVTAIGREAFAYNAKLERVTVPASVTTIDYEAFRSCTALKELKLSDGLLSIGGQAFYNCAALETVYLPETLESIGHGAFWSCESLKSLIIPDSVTELGQSVCLRCTALETVVIGDGVTALDDAFRGCGSLKNVTVGKSLKTLGNSSFSGCGSLESIRLPEGLETIGDYAFSGCTSLKSVYVPNSVKEMIGESFRDCKSLEAFAFPSSLSTIPFRSFLGCESLKKISIPLSIKKISEQVFQSSTQLTDVYYEGDLAAWSAIEVGAYNEPLSAAALHLNSTGIASTWAETDLGKAAKLDLIPDVLKGQDLTKPITRGEFAAVAVKTYENLTGKTAAPAAVNPFTDTADADVLKAYAIGAVNGTSASTFSPEAVLNREQAATMLTRVYKAAAISGWTLANDASFPLNYTMPAAFADDASISAWAKDSVYFMAANGIILGSNGKFMPRATTTAEEAVGYASATREQALLIAVRMVENLG